MVTCVEPKRPYDFRQMLQRPLSRPSKGMVINREDYSLTKAVRLASKVLPVTVSAVDQADGAILRYEYPDGLTPDEREVLNARIEHMFSTSVDLGGFYAVMLNNPRWSGIIRRFYGVRPLHDDNLFECLIKVIVGQQMTVRFASALIGRLVDLVGDTVVWQGARIPVFPSPEQVAVLSHEQLTSLSFSRRKAEYVIDTARRIVEGRLDLDALWAMSDEMVIDQLTVLRGIGRWTAECFLLFGMGRKDVMPAADIGVQNGIQLLFNRAVRPGEAEIRELAQDWRPWRSYATYYLWQSLIDFA